MARIEHHKRRSLSRIKILGGMCAFIFFLVMILVFLYLFASSEKVSYFTGKNPILYNGRQEGNAIIDGKTVYIPMSFMKEHIDESIHFDKKSNSIIITTKDKVVQMPSDSLTYYINEEAVQLHFPPLKDKNGELYLAIDPLLSYYPIEFKRLPDSNGIWIRKNGEEIVHGTVTSKEVHKEKLRLRTETSLRSPYTAQTINKEPLYIEREKGEYYYVRKKNGIAGYINKKYIKTGNKEKIVIEHKQKEPRLPKVEKPVQLTWEAVYTKNPDTEKIPDMPGVNVVSPTWFKLADGNGSIHNLGSLEYVKWAKKKGYQVWGLFSNAFDPELTHQAFNNFETRQRMIRQLLHYSQIYQLDGVNIDIENVNPEDGPFVTQFLREATPYFHEAGLIVSMDITFIAEGNWSSFYERDKLAKIADYLIVMAYDEHWGGSPVAGSVASLPWVEKNLKKLLKIVPKEKLILGAPLYSRLWELKDSGEVSSKALTMEQVKEWLKKHKVKPTYDPESGQNYVEAYSQKDKTTYKIWLEDELSLRKRAALVEQHGLAGIASWSRYFADEKAWAALNITDKAVSKK